MDWENFLKDAWQHHRGKMVGIMSGLIFGLLTVILGFWKALFIIFCLGVGYWLGKRADENGDWYQWFGKIFRD
jgi:uncharacterized membrane protein